MRKQRFFLTCILCIPFLMGFVTHPFFVGVSQIFVETKNAVDNNCLVEVKLFTDDLQRALQQENGYRFLPEKPTSEESQKQLSQYFNNHIHLSLYFQRKPKSKTTVLNVPLFVKGWSVEEEATWVYLLPTKKISYKQLKEIQKIQFENTALFKQINSQTHIVHCIVNGNRKTEQLTSERTKVDFRIK